MWRSLVGSGAVLAMLVATGCQEGAPPAERADSRDAATLLVGHQPRLAIGTRNGDREYALSMIAQV